MPLVHAELAHSNFNVESTVDVLVDITFCKSVPQHLLVNILATFDLANESSSCLGECTQCVTKEILPPFMLSVVGSRRPSSGANTNEDSNFSARPFVDDRFLKNLWCWVVGAGTFIDKVVLTDSDWLECKPGS